MYHVLFNPKAKHGKSKRYLKEVCARLDGEGLPYEVHPTDYPGHAEEIARSIDSAQALIVVGGDGTMHEALNGLQDPARFPLAFVPAGTGNDFCAAANIPCNVSAIMDKVLREEPKDTDYIEMGGRRCLNVGGMGMDVEVLHRYVKSSFHGKIKYLFSLISCIFSFKGYKVRVQANGKTYEENVLFLAACNGSRIGGGIRICPGAEIADGKIELVLVRQMNFFGILRAFIALMRGKILSLPVTEHVYCDSLEIFTDRERTVQLDGELYEGYRALSARIASGLKIYR